MAAKATGSTSSNSKEVFILWGQWGWITPGTNVFLRRKQLDDHLAFLGEPVTSLTKRFMYCHCGWWWDVDASQQVLRVTKDNPEPDRALSPCDRASVKRLAAHVKAGRLEPVVYPYAACVTEATTGEGLLRSLRLSKDITDNALGKPSSILTLHDGVYALNWTAVQLPSIARLLGFRAVWASRDGVAVSPAGDELTLIGHELEIFHDEIDVESSDGTHACILELHNNMELIRELQTGSERVAKLASARITAATANQYLKQAKPKRTIDSRRIGSKNWYGGTIDSLLMEQAIKSVELRLPAIEALAVQQRSANFPKVESQLVDLWKAAFILMDNHILWQCHDYKRHFLPESLKLSTRADRLEAKLLRDGNSVKNSTAIFNPTPWERDCVVRDGSRIISAEKVSGWSVAEAAVHKAKKSTDEDLYTLCNGKQTWQLNEAGQAVGFSDGKSGKQLDALGQLVRIRDEKVDQQLAYDSNKSKPIDLRGSVSASFEMKVPKRLHGEPVSIQVKQITGNAFLLQVDELMATGQVANTHYQALHNLHWGGKGMPNARTSVAGKAIAIGSAEKIRVTIWSISQDRFSIAKAAVSFAGKPHREITRWQVHIHTRIFEEAATFSSAEVVHSDAFGKEVAFFGSWSDCDIQLNASVTTGSPSLAYRLRLNFPKPTRLGVLTPPFSEDDGSLLGAQCERPYIPGICALFPVDQNSRYFADKPYYIREMLDEPEQTWHTDRRNWWMRMSTFIGMNMAVAEGDKNSVGLLTRGLKHFFRWQKDNGESLGLSFGASVIHARTQGHTAPLDSPVYEVIKRTDYNPYGKTSWLRAHGEYVFDYAINIAKTGPNARLTHWKQAQQFALPPKATRASSTSSQTVPGVTCSDDRVVITGLETNAGKMILRAVNMSGREVVVRISVMGKARSLKFKPHQLRQIEWR